MKNKPCRFCRVPWFQYWLHAWIAFWCLSPRLLLLMLLVCVMILLHVLFTFGQKMKELDISGCCWVSWDGWVSCAFAISGVLPGTTLMAIHHYTPVSFQSYSLIFRLCLLTFLASTLRTWVPSWLLQFLEHKTRFDGRNGSDLLMICKALERLSIKNSTWCLWENPNEKSPVSQDMLIKMVRNHQTLQWFRSNALSADNVAMLQQERPEITFVLNYTIITRCWKISRMTSWLLIRRNS
jgi:hypothetical protein